jgi:hypothetical protein
MREGRETEEGKRAEHTLTVLLTEGPIEYAFREKQQESCRAFNAVPHTVLGEISCSVIIPASKCM